MKSSIFLLFCLQDKFEIVVVLEGTVESTGMTAQLRSSYLPSEILWGHLLSPLVTYQKTDGHYKINYTQFHSVVPIEPAMSEQSARVLNDKAKQTDRNGNVSTVSDIAEHNYPVNFTAPTPGMRQKRPWSLRRGSLKGSLRRKGSGNNIKPKSPPSNGMAKFITPSASVTSPYMSTQGTGTSLQSVLEDEKHSNVNRPHNIAITRSPERRSGGGAMRRSESSPEHCVVRDAREQQLPVVEAYDADF